MEKKNYNEYELGEFVRVDYKVRAELFVPHTKEMRKVYEICKNFETLEEANKLYNDESKILDLLHGKDEDTHVFKTIDFYFNTERELDYVSLPNYGDNKYIMMREGDISRLSVMRAVNEDDEEFTVNVRYKFDNKINQTKINIHGKYVEGGYKYEKDNIIQYDKNGRIKTDTYTTEDGRLELSKLKFRYHDKDWTKHLSKYRYGEFKYRTRFQYTENYEKVLYGIRESKNGMVIGIIKFVYLDDGSYIQIEKEKCTGII